MSLFRTLLIKKYSKKMYLLVNKSLMIIGIFTTKENLNMAIEAIKEAGNDSIVYYKEFVPDQFDSDLATFWTMHYEKLIKVDLYGEEG